MSLVKKVFLAGALISILNVSCSSNPKAIVINKKYEPERTYTNEEGTLMVDNKDYKLAIIPVGKDKSYWSWIKVDLPTYQKYNEGDTLFLPDIKYTTLDVDSAIKIR